MKSLVVEDDFTSRNLMQIYLAQEGQCFVAVNGCEGVEAFKDALDRDEPYDLICLDIMMPEMDGQEALRQIRAIEEQRGIGGLDGVKVIMTTALGQNENVLQSFRNGCEAYLIKPIRKPELLAQIEKLGLLAGKH